MSLPALPFRTQARVRCPNGATCASPGQRPGLAQVGPLGRSVAVLGVVTFGLIGDSIAADVPLKDQPHLRRPVASAWIEEGKLLAVANRCGSVSIVDLASQKAIEEIQIGERLADIAAHPKGGWLLAGDEQKQYLVGVRRRGELPGSTPRHAGGPDPGGGGVSPR